MRFKRKTTGTVVGIAAAFFCVLALALILVLQSSWFRDQVRRRLVAQVETVTGGKVEIAGFDYDWRNLTADLQGFTIHGTEAPSAAPLLRVDRASVKVRIISLLERSVDVSSILLTHPQVNVIVAADGSTNIPTPTIAHRGKDPIERLFALKLKHFAIVDGVAQVAYERIPLNVRGDGVAISANYKKSEPSYEFAISSEKIDLDSREVVRGPLHLDALVSLMRNRVVVQHADLTGPEVKVQLTGTADQFAHPRVDFEMDAVIATDQILPLLRVGEIRGGRVAMRGAGHYDQSEGWSFDGRASAQQTNFVSRLVRLENISASADVGAKKSGLVLRHISGTAQGAKVSGEVNIKNYRDLSFEGELSELSLRESAAFFTKRALAWQGVAGGRVRGAGVLNGKPEDFVIQAKLTINPSKSGGGIPVAGNLDLTYIEKTNSLDFGRSQLSFPRSSLAFSGSLRGQNQVVLDSTDLEDLHPITGLLALNVPVAVWPVFDQSGKGHFDGIISNLLSSPIFDGNLHASNVRVDGQEVDEFDAKFTASANGIDFASLDARQGDTHVNGTGLLGFTNWFVKPDSPLRAAIALRRVNITRLAAQFPQVELPIIQGIASGTVQLNGTVGQPAGRGHIASDSLDAYGERLNQVQFDADLTGDQLRVSNGRVVSGAALLNFSGEYAHRADTWTSGQARFKVDSNGFPLASLSPIRKYQPALNAEAELHFEAAAFVAPGRIEPTGATGTIELLNITWNKVPYGNLTLRSKTHGQSLEASISGDFRKNPLHGNAAINLTGENHTTAEIDFDRVTVASVYSLSGTDAPPLFDGLMAAKVRLEGPLEDPAQMKVSFVSDQLELSSRIKSDELDKPKGPLISLHNAGPLSAELFKNVVTVRSFRIEGDQTSLTVVGTVPLDERRAMELQVNGSVNLQAYHLFDPHVASSGVSNIAASVGGTVRDPTVNGILEIKDGVFVPENIPNGLTAVNGTLTFTRNRATLQKMTAKSGGGELALGGFLSFGAGQPLIYHLEGSADNVRVRYAGSISVTASSKLRLSGTSVNSLLSGTLTISRVVFNTNTDVGNILAGLSAGNGAAGGENDFLSGLHMDVVIESAPNLQLSTSLSRDVEAEINLRLRGTPGHPILLGNLSANQGDIQAFGNRYTINRGEISFANPVKVEPVLDLDLETRARGVTVDITLSGTFSKLNVAYRSDPPLQPREIIALLAVGRAPDSTDVARSLRTNQAGTLDSGANSLLGAAVTAPVTNRLSKLFGITNMSFDRLPQGITNTPQNRMTLEQQISRDITITYVTNLSQTSDQIFRFEWALSRQFSVVALRDDNGEFGIDFQYKKQFK